jgi:hypothetical protein
MRRSALLSLLLAALALPTSLAAQEVQVPWDAAGRVEVVETRLARQLGLFLDEYPGFQQARLFELQDGSYLLEVTLVRDGRTLRQRVPLTAGEAAALRGEVRELMARRAPGAAVDHDGRMTLLVTTTALGVSYYGWAVPYILDVDSYQSPGAYNALFMLVAGGSFFLPWMASAGQPVSWGMQQASSYGATRGIAHGWALHALLFGDPPQRGYNLPDVYPHPDPSAQSDLERYERRGMAFSLAASMAEGIAGYAWARNRAVDGGHAAAVGLGGDAGMGAGLLLTVATGWDARRAGALVTTGAAAGLVAGHLVARDGRFTMGDVGLIYTTGTLGLQAGLALALIGEPTNEDGLAALLLVGGAAGLFAGGVLTRQTNFTVAQSSLVSLGTLAGGFAGLGIGSLVAGDDASPGALAVLATAGALAGFIPMYARYAAEARLQPHHAGPGLTLSVAPSLIPARGAGEPALRPGLSASLTF